MIRRPPRSTRTDTRFPYTTLFRSKHGANRTGRPFTGDYAGVLLYDTLKKFGLAEGVYEERVDDSLRLTGCAIINSVKCLPPQNKPRSAERRGGKECVSTGRYRWAPYP